MPTLAYQGASNVHVIFRPSKALASLRTFPRLFRHKACTDNGMRPQLIPRDVQTRWNSLYDMLSVAVTYKDVINAFTGDRNVGYRAYDLTNAQWTFVEDMLHVLKVCY
jgi:hypothetical protein